MNKKFISQLLIASILATSISGCIITNPKAETLNSIDTIEENNVQPRTKYDWWVYNLGVSPSSKSQIKGPTTQGSFNTEAPFSGTLRKFTIEWSNKTGGSNFYIYAYDLSGNYITSSGSCSGSSGSKTLTIPYDKRGNVKLYVYNASSSTINLGSIHVTNDRP